MKTADHCAHVELLYSKQLLIAQGQAAAMETLGCDDHARIVHGIIADLERKLKTVQNRDDSETRLENTRFGDDLCRLTKIS